MVDENLVKEVSVKQMTIMNAVTSMCRNNVNERKYVINLIFKNFRICFNKFENPYNGIGGNAGR